MKKFLPEQKTIVDKMSIYKKRMNTFIVFAISVIVLNSFNSQGQDCSIEKIDCPPTFVTICADKTVNGIFGTNVSWIEPQFKLACTTTVPGDDYSFYVEFNLPEGKNTCWQYNNVQRIGSNNLRLWQSTGTSPDVYFITPTQYFNNTSGTPVNMQLIVGSGKNINWTLQVLDGTNVIHTQTISNISSGSHLKTITIPNTVPNGEYNFKFIFTGDGNNSCYVDRIYYNATLIDGPTCAGGINFLVSSDRNPGDFFPVGSTPVTYTAIYTSSTGEIQTVNCPFNVIVDGVWGNITPVNSSCIGNDGVISFSVFSANTTSNNLLYRLDGGSSIALTGTSVTGTSSINGTTTNFVNVTGSISNVTSGNHTLIITDNELGCSNTFNVTVGLTPDTEGPEIAQLPAVSTINCPSIPSFANASASDACGSDFTLTYEDVTTAGACNGNYSVTRTWTAIDEFGNSSTASQTINVQDVTAPVINQLPAVSTIECPASPSFAQAIATDDCDASVTLTYNDVTTPGSCTGNYSVTRTWTATDDCGNSSTSSQTINVKDTNVPVVNCVQNQIRWIAESNATAYIASGNEFDFLSASDNCGEIVSVTNNLNGSGTLQGHTFATGTTTVIWSATDNCGNTGSCSFDVVVKVDVTPYMLCVLRPIELECGTNYTEQVTAWLQEMRELALANAQDDVTELTLANISHDYDGNLPAVECEDNFDNASGKEVTITVTDEMGNSTSCVTRIKIIDSKPPVINPLPAISTINCPDEPLFAEASATDLCDDNVTLTFTDVNTPGSCAGSYSVTRTWTATDDCGNFSTASQTINIQDVAAPAFSCPTNITTVTDNGKSYATVIITVPSVTETCGNFVLVNDFTNTSNASGQYPLGTTTVTYTATDDCGNETSCTFNVIVNDDEAPAINCPSTITVDCIDLVPNAFADFNAFVNAGGSASDNNGINLASFGLVSQNSDNNNCPETITRIYTVSDNDGNKSQCSQTILVYDQIAPVIKTNAANGSLGCNPTVVAPEFTVTDNCAVSEQIDVQTTGPVGSSNGSEWSQTWTANVSDDCNNPAIEVNITYSWTISTSETIEVTNCDVVTVNGSDYTVSGTYTQNLTNAVGCDSTLTIVATVLKSTSETIEVTNCDVVTVNGTDYTVSGTYTQNLQNIAGCDSTLTIVATVLKSTSETIEVTNCDVVSVNGSDYTVSGTYTQNLQNIAGCDSTLTIVATVLKSTSETIEVTNCDVVSVNGTDYTVSGTYTQNLQNIAGCDSTLTIVATVLKSTSETIEETACNAYLWNGNEYTVSGTYSIKFTNAAGCDSTATLVLTITTCAVIPEMILEDDDISTLMNEPIAVSVKNNDSGIPEGSTLTAPTITAINGAITVNNDGSVTYTPPTDFIGEDTFDYKITTPDGRIDSATVTIVTTAPKELLIDAINDEFEIYNDELAEGSIIINDINPIGEIVVSLTPDVAPENGTVVIDTDGSIVYTPNDGYSGIDSFSYRICNSIVPTLCDEAVVTIYVLDTDTITPPPLTPCEIFIPNGFSPNDDGINDYFVVEYCDDLPNVKVEIFNRWGNLVYEKENYGNIDRWGDVSAWWDGRSTNSWTVGKDKLPPGTYFYILYFNDGNKEPKAGSIFLNR
ncbi:MAG TPA: HYR domain-containing protein [Draconibacterium sp.]|nr:HYR domain-containing protein [Draconibacterium sp.]